MHFQKFSLLHVTILEMYILTNTVETVDLLQVFKNESVIKKCAAAAAHITDSHQVSYMCSHAMLLH